MPQFMKIILLHLKLIVCKAMQIYAYFISPAPQFKLILPLEWIPLKNILWPSISSSGLSAYSESSLNYLPLLCVLHTCIVSYPVLLPPPRGQKTRHAQISVSQVLPPCFVQRKYSIIALPWPFLKLQSPGLHWFKVCVEEFRCQ